MELATIFCVSLHLFGNFIFASANIEGEIEEELILVHAIFRHGDRTVEPLAIYPNDPYINETYFPYGPAQLTNRGKLREYNLGQFLRYRYDRFLGDLYTPEIVEARSTDFPRTRMSLELVLAGLFPPNEILQWHPALNWQPIPYNFVPRTQDKLLSASQCPNFALKYREYVQSDQVQAIFRANKDTFDYLSENSGFRVEGFDNAANIFVTLKSECEWGLPLPYWAEAVYPEPLQSYTVDEYKLRSGTTELRKIIIGEFLKKIVDDSQAKIDGNADLQDRKIFLYSGHEHNLATLLNTLDIFDSEYPRYGSCVMFEVIKRNNQFGMKIFYHNYYGEDPVLLKLPECSEFCPWNQFVGILKKYFPDEDTCGY